MAATTFPALPPSVASGGSSSNYRTRRADFGDGYVQATGAGLNTKQTKWSLAWTSELNGNVATIEAFLDERAGSKPFWWTPPGASSATLWACAGFSTRPTGPDSTTLSAEFVRWFGAEEW